MHHRRLQCITSRACQLTHVACLSTSLCTSLPIPLPCRCHSCRARCHRCHNRSHSRRPSRSHPDRRHSSLHRLPPPPTPQGRQTLPSKPFRRWQTTPTPTPPPAPTQQTILDLKAPRVRAQGPPRSQSSGVCTPGRWTWTPPTIWGPPRAWAACRNGAASLQQTPCRVVCWVSAGVYGQPDRRQLEWQYEWQGCCPSCCVWGTGSGWSGAGSCRHGRISKGWCHGQG